MPTPRPPRRTSAPDPGTEIKEAGRPPGRVKVGKRHRPRKGGAPGPGREFREGLRPPERRPPPTRRTRSR